MLFLTDLLLVGLIVEVWFVGDHLLTALKCVGEIIHEGRTQSR